MHSNATWVMAVSRIHHTSARPEAPPYWREIAGEHLRITRNAKRWDLHWEQDSSVDFRIRTQMKAHHAVMWLSSSGTTTVHPGPSWVANLSKHCETVSFNIYFSAKLQAGSPKSLALGGRTSSGTCLHIMDTPHVH